MKRTILRLVVLVLFAAIGGFAAQAQDYYVHYDVIEGAHLCNKEELWLAIDYEVNLPGDAHVYAATYINGVLRWDNDTPLSGYLSGSGWFIEDGAGFVPYSYRKILIYYSESGHMPTYGFAFNLSCDEFNVPTVSMEELPF